MLAKDNTWYHIRIDFEGGIRGYLGLSQYYWRLSVNGENPIGDIAYNSNSQYINGLRSQTGSSQICNFYIDSLDFSWNEGYYYNRNNIIVKIKLHQ